MISDAVVDVPELGVAVRMLLALDGLGARLQAEPLCTQQAGHHVSGDPVPLAGEVSGEVAGGLGRSRPTAR